MKLGQAWAALGMFGGRDMTERKVIKAPSDKTDEFTETMEEHGCTFKEAVKIVARRHGWFPREK